ncbi:MAG TPA: zf-HC2 domain-containing protein [Pyrinomonadaceae bacterium]|jgi:anti-sigma factor RsiW
MSLKRCLDEGSLQSYLDGELAADRMKDAESHLAACAACAEALREAEGELFVFASAFAEETPASVPSEQLRRRIEAAIAQQQHSQTQTLAASTGGGWNLKNWLSELVGAFSLTPARVAAFTSIAAVVAFALIFGLILSRQRGTDERPQLAVNNPSTTERAASSKTAAPTVETAMGDEDARPVEEVKTTPAPAERKRAASGVEFRQARALRAARVRSAQPVERKAVSNEPALLPGEENYLKEIASLSSVVRAGGDALMRPALRADFERNLAVVDQAIRVSRSNALRNPSDRNAKEFLFSAYQSKVELLGAVAGQAQVAAVER